jgi:NTE family protein
MTPPHENSHLAKTGLILMGGGARAAYQVGVLDSVRAILVAEGWPAAKNPFPIICGTSAGALNAAALAASSSDFEEAMKRILNVWSHFRASQVYRTDALGSFANAAHWLAALGLGWMIKSRPRSLFDNSPLADLLKGFIDFARLRRAFAEGHMHALAVTASSYTSGQHVTYYQSRQKIDPWFRTQRLAVSAEIELAHLMASSAIPFVFPAVSLQFDQGREFFGDGSIRQTAPISPAIHLGADRVMVIGVGRLQIGSERTNHSASQYAYPSLAQIGGHTMSSIFLDALANDVERLSRVNQTLTLIPEQTRLESKLRPIKVLVISPSQRLDQMAAPHVVSLPRTVRTMMSMLGATEQRGLGLMSYLLFESSYTRELIELGRKDTLTQRDRVIEFFGAPSA